MKRTGNAYAASERQLSWFYQSGDAAMGYHAMCFDDSAGPCIWDDARIDRAHLTRRTFRHREDVEKHGRIHANLNQLSTLHRLRAEMVYAPRNWDVRLTSLLGCGSGGSLVALGLTTKAATSAFEKRFKRQPGATAELLAFLTWEAWGGSPDKAQAKALKLPRSGLFPAIRTAALLLRDEMLESYDAIRTRSEREAIARFVGAA